MSDMKKYNTRSTVEQRKAMSSEPKKEDAKKLPEAKSHESSDDEDDYDEDIAGSELEEDEYDYSDDEEIKN